MKFSICNIYATCILCTLLFLQLPFFLPLLHAATPYTPTHPDPALEPWRWTVFPELKGLGLVCMAEDGTGRIWFGVDDGVRVYDGVKWTAYTEADGIYGSPVQTLCVTRDGSVYAGTRSGISRFRDGAWSRMFPLEGDWSWFVWDLLEASDGSLWAATGWGALRLRQGEALLFTAADMEAGALLRMPEAQLFTVPDEAAPIRTWSRPGGFAFWWSGRPHFEIFYVHPGGSAEAAGLRIGDRIVAVDGGPPENTWSGAAGSSAVLTVRREGREGPFEVTVKREAWKRTYRNFNIYDVYEDRDGAMWFGLRGGEILRCDIRSARPGDPSAWRLYTEADGLQIGIRPCIHQTRDGTIWTASMGERSGVNRFDGQAWTSLRLSEMEGRNNNPSILETQDGMLWVGGHMGYLHAFRDGAWTVYKTPDVPVPSNFITGLLEASDGALWIAGYGQEAVRLDYGTSRWTTYEGLLFGCETPDGAQWFICRDGGVVRRDGAGRWTRYGVEDGLMEDAAGLLTTRKGELWAVGSHGRDAATARFDGSHWSLQTHPQLSSRIFPKSVYESPDGTLWFGAASRIPERGHLSGILRFDGQAWTHYKPPEVPRTNIYGIGQTADGAVWIGGNSGLWRFDGQAWTQITEPEAFTSSPVDAVYTTPEGDLWVGTRHSGAFYYGREGKRRPNEAQARSLRPDPDESPGVGTWIQYDVRDGLADNSVESILQTDNGDVWVATARGISRFDGWTWTTYALPSDLHLASRGYLRQSRDGAIWINEYDFDWIMRAYLDLPLRESASLELRTIRYAPDAHPPQTEITLSLDRVSQPGNTTLSWKGADPWRATPDDEIQYAWRLDNGEWSAFSHEESRIFELLPSGRHTFEVKARDRDFNEDPTPASVTFTVVPPVWQEPWFIGLMAVLLGAIGLQTGRVIRRDRRLRDSNAALSTANRELQRDRAVERVRAEVTAMRSADDLQDVVREMLEELSRAGVAFDLCVINIVDEEAGVRRQYGATREGWSGQAEAPLSEVSEAFMAIYRGDAPAVRPVDDALAAVCARTREQLGITEALTRPTAVVDAPFAYGTLSLQTQSGTTGVESEVGKGSTFTVRIPLVYEAFARE